jgi:MFS family permease
MTEPRILTRPFGFLVAAHALQALGFSSMLLLPLYLDYLGADRGQIGLVMAAASLGGLAGRPLVGWGLDVKGRRPVLFVGTVVLVAGMFLIGAITELSWLVYLMRILVGLGSGALFTGYFTFAADIIPESRRTEGIALFGVSGLLPLLINPFADQIGVEPPDLRWFFPVMGLCVAASLLFLPAVPEPTGTRSPDRVTLRSALDALRRVRLAPVWTATAVFAALVAIFMSFATVTAEARGAENPSTVWLTYALGAVMVRLVGAKLPEKLGPSLVGGAALLSYALAFVVLAQATTGTHFAIAGLLGGFGHGYCFPVLMSQVVTRSPDALRGVAVAAFTGLWGISRLFSAPSFGEIADRWGDSTMLYLAAALGVLGVVAWAVLERLLGDRT